MSKSYCNNKTVSKIQSEDYLTSFTGIFKALRQWLSVLFPLSFGPFSTWPHRDKLRQEHSDILQSQTFHFDGDFCVCLEMEQLDGHIVSLTNTTDSTVILMVVCVSALSLVISWLVCSFRYQRPHFGSCHDATTLLKCLVKVTETCFKSGLYWLETLL